MVWTTAQELAKSKMEIFQLRKFGEEACGPISERRFKMCGSLPHFMIYQTMPLAKQALNNQVDGVTHPVEISLPLFSSTPEHAQLAHDLVAMVAGMECTCGPTAWAPCGQG